MTLIFHTLIPTANQYMNYERTHRQRAATVKRNTETALVTECRQQKAQPVADYPVHLNYLWFRRDKRTDKSNIIFGQKFVEDALQTAGVLRNDGWKEINSIVHEFAIDQRSPRLVLTITQAQENENV